MYYGDIVNLKTKKKDTKKEQHPQTVMVNNAQREKSRKAVREALSWLSTTFPKTFNVEGAIRPLKVGIDKDILAFAEANGGLPFSKSVFHKVLVVFTRRMEYLTCVKMRDTRVDLNGEEVEPVSEEAAKLAILQIKKIVEKGSRIRRKAPARGPKAAFPPRTAPKRPYSSPYGSNPHHHASRGNGNEGSYRDRDVAPREHIYGGYHQETQSPATIKVKRRYVQKEYEANPYSQHTQAPERSVATERNYNSESYNTEASTVDRLKAKLGIKTRHDRF